MNYLRCINNKGFIWQNGQLLDEEMATITVGAVYKAVATSEEERANGFVRIIDNSGEDYLYPADRFEPMHLNHKRHNSATITIHLDPRIRDILHAEALATQGFISGLVRTWIEERLDLPESM